MAGKHEMICTQAPIPVWISFGDDIDVISNGLFDRGDIEGLGLVYEFNHLGDAERQKEDMSKIRVPSPIPGVHFHAVDEPSLRRVYAPAGAIMEQWRLTFFIHIHLEQPLHFQITPACMFSSHQSNC